MTDINRSQDVPARSQVQLFSPGQAALLQEPISCASEVAAKMGASDEEMVMVAGFAGGLGLSGNACGALAVIRQGHFHWPVVYEVVQQRQWCR